MTEPDVRAWGDADERALADLLLRHSTVHGVVFLDPTGRMRGWNRGAEFITGFTAAEALGQPCSMLYTPEDRERQLDEQELRIATEVGVAEDERWHVRKDGARIWTTGVTMPLRDEGDAVTGFVKIFRDASHLRSRIRFLENEQMECAAVQARNEYFVSSIAHELRNPLTPLKTSLHLLQMQARQFDTLQQPLRVMDRQLGFLERLVEDLVDLTRVKTGKLALSYSNVVLQEIIAEATDAAGPSAAAKRVLVQPVLPPLPLEVEADRERLLQVVVNLLNNAIKFTPEGGTVWISLTADQTHCLVFVKDNGKGIDPQLLPRVFDAFTQAEGAGTQRGTGIGLGLAVVKEIVSLLKGTVEVRSEGEGKGSEFIVRVPLRRPAGPDLERLPPSMGTLAARQRPGDHVH